MHASDFKIFQNFMSSFSGNSLTLGKQIAAESSNKSTKDIQHCLERGISRIFVSTLAFACFPMSFKAKCQVNWYSEIIAHCVAI